MEQQQSPASRADAVRRLGRRIAGYYTGVIAPGASRMARARSAGKALAASAAIGFVLLAAYSIVLIPFTPSTADLRKAKSDQPSVLMSIDGKRIATFRRSNREWVKLQQISPNVINALISTEDRRFYEHGGIDFRRTLASIAHTLTGDTQGGSTLTQQLARNLYPDEIGRSRSLTRKIKEVITALKIERAYTKDEILETYLNTVPFLYNAFGIEMAARTYFDKPAAKLSVLESATLIGMLKGTSYYNPVSNPERAQKRRNVVLSQMNKAGLLTDSALAGLKKRPIRLDFERQDEDTGPAPHFAEFVRKWLIEWADNNDYNIYLDGLVVTTTLDSRLQAAANQAVARQLAGLQAVADVEWGMASSRLLSSSMSTYAGMRRRIQPFSYFWKSRDDTVDAFVRESGAYRAAVDGGAAPAAALAQLRADSAFMNKLRDDKTRLQAGFIAMDPANGEVRAWVGSRDFQTDQYDHVARAQRQPGSTFKPFVYGAALVQGMLPDNTFIDKAVEIPLGGGAVWRPSDLSPPSNQSMTLRQGLMYSKNTITAQVMQEVGPKRVVDLAVSMGVNQSKLDPVPALALGTSPVTMLEMATAYSAIANGGDYRQPVVVTRIADRNGRVLAEFEGTQRRALPAVVAQDLVDILRAAVTQGTGAAIRSQFGIQADVAGKTGTTQNNTDGWFMLMHPGLVSGAWVGFNDARVTMRSSYWGQGAHNALYVVGDFFRQAQNGRLVDVGARFGGGSVVSPMLERMDGWLGRDKHPLAVPVDPADPGPEEVAPAEPRQDELERIIEQAREAVQ
ncbi:penicillin-binding protein 1A [Noviherbaspirillum suwonense]|uniref:Penicillin-binding protein 1A n=2 Tax=Noviherbaspirillum suwonense TaxID=1224511 RepID=A0ABY1PR12_9BURK|nr:penicillin-binding protein 1A [Noviherbaspirillum suwonense]